MLSPFIILLWVSCLPKWLLLSMVANYFAVKAKLKIYGLIPIDGVSPFV